MLRSTVGLATALGAAALVTVGCGSDTKGVGVRCHDFATQPGSVALLPGIRLAIRNRQGQPVAMHASVAAVSGGPVSYVGLGENKDSLNLNVYVGPGTYSVRLGKPFYRDTTISNIVVLPGDCGTVQVTNRAVVLETAADAPPFRSVTVFGSMFLATPGLQTHVIAIVDADSGLSRAVTWRSSDTTMATIDQTGLVVAKCSLHGGVDTVTATSVVDPKLNGWTTLGIGASGSC